MEWLKETLRHYPEIAAFFVLAAGFFIGKLKVGKFTLGTVTSVLLVGILVGQWDISIPAESKSIFFLLFLFSMGYSIGPQFFQGLKKDGLSQALFSATICITSLALGYVLALLFGFTPGTGAGLLSGANTCSAIIGVAGDSISKLNITEGLKKDWTDQIAVAYAVTYIFGTAGTAWFLSVIGPILLGGNVAEKAKELEAEMGSTGEDGENITTAYDQVAFRAYKLTTELFKEGLSVKAMEDFMVNRQKPLYVQRIRRKGEVVEVMSDTKLQLNDVIAVSGQRSQIVGAEEFLGEEIMDSGLLSFPIEVATVIAVKKSILGHSLGALRRRDSVHGVGVRKLTRAGIEIPVTHRTTIEKGDALELVGVKEDLNNAVKKIGYKEKSGIETDIVYVGIGIVIGSLVGALSVKAGDIPLSISTSGGSLIAGLFFGWLRTRRPVFGNIPAPSVWLLQKLGLHMFIAIVGISSSSGFVKGLQQEGVNLFIAGVILSILPMVLALYLARYVFKFHPAIALGACAGAHDESAALLAVQDAVKSKIPALGYTVTYAVANILLTISGAVIVMLLYHS
ncbi:aspartate-alanine antiporter [Pseudobacter ginsenosidimutans]|uniref:Putative transport protein n=1 Tax=Pseudobacter ginsenosidimutans TaxID=661488 RepID=A0A4Q7N267_9BACT|nr:aspartate-alanine antiporter [Pseudobacter ginsenosidimutans]QEC43402.1 aspartate-alanine antiporter [Pseudobacter ginsenosidimutans]RZS74774.1 putative transport protein [Pseudobacter ginsenosidimutans]